MAIPPVWRGGERYGAERVEERLSKEPLRDVDLAGVGAERTGLRVGGAVRYSGR
jgi:hypothetical protein